MSDFVHNGAFIAVIGHGLIGVSLVWDKVLLKRRGTRNVFNYVFWLGALSVFGVILVPFGYTPPPFAVIAIAFGAGVVHLTGIVFYYRALKRGEASETLAIMGGFSPAATAAVAYVLLAHWLSGLQLAGFIVLTGGGFLMFFSEQVPRRSLLPPILLASGLLGLVNVLQKLVFSQTNFVSGYVWFTVGTFAAAMALLLPSGIRRQVLAGANQSTPSSRSWYFVNRFAAGIGSFLIFYAISLTHPAVVDAIAGVRYAIIFIGTLLLTKLKPSWLKETFRGTALVVKIAATALVVAGLILVAMQGGRTPESGSTSTHLRTTAQRDG